MDLVCTTILINSTEFDGVGLQIWNASSITVEYSEFRAHLSSTTPQISVTSFDTISDFLVAYTCFTSAVQLPEIQFDSTGGNLTIGLGCCFPGTQTASVVVINGDLAVQSPAVWNCICNFTDMTP
jgi:hypothetical protein